VYIYIYIYIGAMVLLITNDIIPVASSDAEHEHCGITGAVMHPLPAHGAVAASVSRFRVLCPRRRPTDDQQARLKQTVSRLTSVKVRLPIQSTFRRNALATMMAGVGVMLVHAREASLGLMERDHSE